MTDKTTEALKLAEQEKQEPVAAMEVFSGWEDIADVEILYHAAKKLPDGDYKLYAAPVSAPKQEPVGEVKLWSSSNGFQSADFIAHKRLPDGTHKLYAAPVSVEAAVLAEQEACYQKLMKMSESVPHEYFEIAAAAIRARGEK